MRRVVLAAAVCLGGQLILPRARTGLVGVVGRIERGGPFQGLEFETRLYRFGQNQRPPDAELTRAAAEQVASAFDLFNQVMTDAKLAIETKRGPGGPVWQARRDRDGVVKDDFAGHCRGAAQQHHQASK